MRTSFFCSALLAAVCAAGQPAASVRAFEVASIRPNPGPWKVLLGYSVAGQLLTLEGYSVPDLVAEAYGLESYQLVLPPELPRQDKLPPIYNIAAKAPGSVSPTRAEFREMLQELLSSRFHLKFYSESREIPAYTLRLARNGSKLRESKSDAPAVSNHRVRGRNQTIESTHVTMEKFARELRMFVDRPVVDRTGLSGEYDIELEATPFFRLTSNPQPEDITMFAAIQESLGLRLDAERVSLPVVVVDGIEQPTEN
jgi:uncharacterized protein (TIGR03435 family)